MVIDKCGPDSMIYGCRKSYFFREPTAVKNYTAAKDLLQADGRAVDKMEQLLGILTNK